MILICELLTEEPEGGSAMIPFYVFSDLYRFLAKIEGCEQQVVRNYLFTESNLDLTKKEEPDVMSDGKFEQLDRSLVSDKIEEEEMEAQYDAKSDLEKYLKTLAVDAVSIEKYRRKINHIFGLIVTCTTILYRLKKTMFRSQLRQDQFVWVQRRWKLILAATLS